MIRRESSRIQTFFKTLKFYQQHQVLEIAEQENNRSDKLANNEKTDKSSSRKRRKRRSHSFNIRGVTGSQSNNNDIYYKIEYKKTVDQEEPSDTSLEVEEVARVRDQRSEPSLRTMIDDYEDISGVIGEETNVDSHPNLALSAANLDMSSTGRKYFVQLSSTETSWKELIFT